MQCHASTRTCTFQNIRNRYRYCTWSLRFVAHDHRNPPQHLSQSGNLVIAPNGRRSVTFYVGRDHVRRIKDANLECRHRQHWGSPPPPPTQPPVVRNSRGVDMQCHASTRTCTFHNIRARDRFCTWSVDYLVPGRPPVSRAGNMVIPARSRRSATFHFGRAHVIRIRDASVLCRHRRHW